MMNSRYCFNPVAGIHCNESRSNDRSGMCIPISVSIPLPGFIVMKVPTAIYTILEDSLFQSRCRDSL